MFSCLLPFQGQHLPISMISVSVQMLGSLFLIKQCGVTQWSIENPIIKTEDLSQKRVNFHIILFVWSWLKKTLTLHVNIFFMYSEHKVSSVLPY